ncbi:MAG TPA: MBOAT family O-acyltransferase [Alphaproteobacteria bacterium]|jgi:alginate O-acetyltransferase complex protein AlgI
MFFMTEAWLYIAAAVTLVHWLLPGRWRSWWIAGATAAFLGWMSPDSLVILAALAALYYWFAGREDRISGRRLIGLISATAAVLCAYKIHAAMMGGIDLHPGMPHEDIIIPLGLSYYAFRCIHYGIEKYKGVIPKHPLAETVQYLFFLPTLITGPIHRFPAFQKDLHRKRWDPFLFTQGLERILYGYVKIAFLANLVVTNLFGVFIMHYADVGSWLEAWLKLWQVGANMYFLFAGASDVAIGFGMLLGIKVMENFNWPFLSRNISDFWTRWHISLTSWCRDYVYMGTIATTRSAALAALAAMLVMGLWHEFSPRYLLWAAFQGAGIMGWQQFQKAKLHLPAVKSEMALRALRVFSTLLTLHYVMLGMLLVHYPTLDEALAQIGKIVLFR